MKTVLLTLSLLLVCAAMLAMASKIRKKGSTLGRHFKDNPVFDQKALLGPRKHYEELAKLSAESRKARLVSLARSHDTNGDDILEIEELEAWIVEAYRISDHDTAADKFVESDTDKDGRVSEEEALFLRHFDVPNIEGMTKSREELIENRRKAVMKDDHLTERYEEDKHRFKASDMNKDGYLNKEEYLHFHAPFEFTHMMDFEMDIHMERTDDNKDGVISLDEFVEGSEYLTEGEMAEVKQKFKEVDYNKDNKISRAELQIVYLPSNLKTAADDALAIIQDADKNRDGKVSILEMVKEEEVFLKSAVTNYGLHLHLVRDEL